MNQDDIEADIAVVGAGLAGLTAACRAAEAGCRVVVLEAGEAEAYACNTRIATGVLNMAHADPLSGEPALRKAIADDTEGYADPVLADLLARTAGPALEWLRASGARAIRVMVQGSPVWMLAPPRLPQTGHEWQGYGADLVMKALVEKLLKQGSTIEYGIRARRLRMENGACVGLDAERGGAAVRLAARQVVLADGGFQGNVELVRRFISPRPECLAQRSAGTGRGDALVMAEEAGARLTEADCFYGHLHCQDAINNALLWPYPTMDTLVGGCIMVDHQGRRFADEGLGGVTLANVLARLEDPLSATAIFDQNIWESSGRVERVAPNPHLVQSGGTLITAPDLPSLARALDRPERTLVETVTAYNAAIDSGSGHALVPPRTAGRAFGVSRAAPERVKLFPIATPPFHAVRLCAGISFTMGGIEIDAQARVLSREGEPLPGLLAAGSCTGGIEGGPIAGYIGGLMKAACLGLVAGDTAARACSDHDKGD